MTLSPLVIFHICAGTTGILSGAAALFSRKGSRQHRAAGNLFFISMLSLSASGAYLGFVKPVMISFVAGILTFYLVATGWLTVMRKERETGLLDFALLLLALANGANGLIFGQEAANSATGLKDGYPAVAYFVFGSVALICAAGDIRMLVRGGVSGAQRIVRHLWRMCFALLIAALSFAPGGGVFSLFRGETQTFPEAIRQTQLLNVPIIVIVVLMLYWLWRVSIRQRFQGAVGVSSSAVLSAKPPSRQRITTRCWIGSLRFAKPCRRHT
jgi:hypothetical protein